MMMNDNDNVFNDKKQFFCVFCVFRVLFAYLRDFPSYVRHTVIDVFCSPQKSPSLPTVVTAIIEIHCLRSSEQALLTKLNSVMKNNYEGIFDPGFIKSQYPSK